MIIPRIEDVDPEIYANDNMYAPGDLDHYFSVGRSALENILAALSKAKGKEPKKILDFGSGAGRVTRWLIAAFPNAKIDARDVREEDMDFLRNTFGIEAEAVSPDVDSLKISGRYDLIWVGSVITHLPAAQTRRLIGKLFSRLERKGVLIATFHGQHAISLRDSGAMIYIHDEAWKKIRSEYFSEGYGYEDYHGMGGYGISVASQAWIIGLTKQISHARLLMVTEHSWDNHHDVFALQRTGTSRHNLLRRLFGHRVSP